MRRHSIAEAASVLVLIAVGAAILYQIIAPPVETLAQIALRVGAAYGERYPRVVTATSSTTDNPPHDPMYLMKIAGRFHKGHLSARYLEFSALADRMYVWGIQAYNTLGKNLWFDDLLQVGR
jgi:hypothetical protein